MSEPEFWSRIVLAAFIGIIALATVFAAGNRR